ncbi:MAG: polysaccharide biosynthesis/export family protein [Gammaproteobacteria bacterium]|nr:polysaccharide biosynthesis/export family protein [Gammaproteobacteria bacterium]MBI5616672.1 polysaccharide biosynthesis/export family protein [Gammaproteobacteria bacterium]
MGVLIALLRARRCAAAAVALSMLLAGCDKPVRPNVTGPDGATKYLDQLSPEETRTAQQTIFRGLTKGVTEYRLVPGDQVQFLFLLGAGPESKQYVIGVGDKLRIDFFYQPDASRTVVVRPDGMITLPLKGDLQAVGLAPEKLAALLQEQYSDIFKDPKIDVSVERYTSRLEDLGAALKSAQDGNAKKVTVAPDGRIYLPLVPPVDAGGMSVDEILKRVNQLYKEQIGNVSVSLMLDKVMGNRLFVFGEVRNPGMLTMPNSQTALQAITSAGGALTTGAMQKVKVVSWAEEGAPRVRTLNLEAVLDGKNIEQDEVVPSNSVIYVPPTAIATADRVVDDYVSKLLLFKGFNVGMSTIYEIDKATNTTTVTSSPATTRSP